MFKAIYPVIGNEVKLPFYLCGIGKNNPEFHVKRDDGLVSHQLLFTENGSGEIVVNGKKYTLEKDSLLFLPPSVAHEYYPVCGNWYTKWIVFRGENLQQIMSNLNFSTQMVVKNCDLSVVRSLFDRIFSLASDNLHNSEKCSLLIYELVLASSHCFFDNNSLQNTGSAIVDNAVKFINERYYDDISLDKLAQISNVTPQHFCRLFKARLNMKTSEYITRVRINKAKLLLIDTNKSVGEISGMVGFQSLTYFGMVFRKIEGVTPAQYRKNKGSVIL